MSNIGWWDSERKAFLEKMAQDGDPIAVTSARCWLILGPHMADIVDILREPMLKGPEQQGLVNVAASCYLSAWLGGAFAANLVGNICPAPALPLFADDLLDPMSSSFRDALEEFQVDRTTH